MEENLTQENLKEIKSSINSNTKPQENQSQILPLLKSIIIKKSFEETKLIKSS